jgi:endoglucanase
MEEQKTAAAEFGVIEDRRRGGDRRAGSGNARLAPFGVDRRRGERRALPEAVLVGALIVVATSAAPSATLAADADVSAMGKRSVTASSPLAVAPLYVDPSSSAKKAADSLRSSQPANAKQLDKIAAGAQATWFAEWSGDALTAVDRKVSTAAAAGAVPVLVAYNIPNRDCSGGYSAGGAKDGAAYRDWIRRFALGIGSRRAIVVLEPDALAQLDKCGSVTEQQDRLDMIWDAVQVLKANAATSVYIDAGHSRWMTADVAAARLKEAGIADADGFSLNVSNFNPTANEVTYGKAIASKTANKHFVVDTSRNGLGPSTAWCNPSGQALGPQPTASTGDPSVDAYLWVKRPGESDGTCNGGPSAGTFWTDYALGLAKRAAF